jgi:uncharacterized protein
MLRRIGKRARRRLKLALIVMLLLFIGLNGLAFMHARAMTHFGPPGVRPPKPWEMSISQKVRGLFFGVTIPRPTNDFTPAKFDLPFETVRFRSSDGIDLEAWHIPCDNPHGLILCFHGYMNSKAGELRESKVFRDLGLEMMLVDFRGSGGSSGNETTVGYREADDIAASVDYARTHFHPTRLILYGQSMGSAAILRAMAVHDVKPDAIIVECPYDRMLNTIANRFTSMGVPSFPAARLLLFWGSLQEGYWAFGLNPVDYASSVTCPALLIRGADDPWVTEPEARSIVDHFRGEKWLVSISHAGHEGSYARDPEKWSQTVAEFIGRAVSYVPGMDRR